VNWQRKIYEILMPLLALLLQILKRGSVLRMDETTVQVMGEEDRSDTQKSWLARGGPPDKSDTQCLLTHSVCGHCVSA
jgi:hypothetical protein